MLVEALIAYNRRNGTTKTIAQWLSEGIAADCTVANVADAASLDYDLIVVGSLYTPMNHC
jgi:menaquinone-dependent protoporphyrinogen IX oxidase